MVVGNVRVEVLGKVVGIIMPALPINCLRFKNTVIEVVSSHGVFASNNDAKSFYLVDVTNVIKSPDSRSKEICNKAIFA